MVAPQMITYFLNRLFWMLPTAFGVVTLTFFITHLTPGDPVEVLLGEHALPADREALRAAMGLHLPLWEQYWQFLVNTFMGNLGVSFYSGENVAELIKSRLPATGILALAALGFAVLVSTPLGIAAAANKKGVADKTSLVFMLLGVSVPSFCLGPILIIIFSLWVGVLPVSGFENWQSLVLPAVTLGVAMAAILTRLLRASLIEILDENFVRTAKAKGATKNRILYQHALKAALLPVITVVFLQAGALFTGAIITEAVFSWPGVGSLIVDALNRRDYPLVQGCVLFIAFVYMGVTLLSDLLYSVADPRVRQGS